ncbi:uncharacterized protein LOC136064118 [Quercus suber]|uniref:uncharacterized protein LOC136064118 n=1 Tax=Quercus suber TaxID=58331 RepID=UPI000D27BAEB|nr:hypothetical protein CFP56_56423 [Quercus suber]
MYPQHVKWKPPTRPCLRVNFDGVVFKEENMAGPGVVIRDENGQVIASMAEKVSLLNFVATAIEEALAIVKVVTFAQDIGLTSVIVEGDLEIIINSLKSDHEFFVTYGHLIEG